MIVPLPLLLVLILIASFSSCSKPNLGDIVREHIRAVNNDDVEENLTFFTDDTVFEIFDDVKLSGKDQLRELMESDVVNKARLTISDIKVEGDTVIVDLTEKNEGYRLLGIEEDSFTAIYKFRGRLLESVKLEGTPEGAKLYDEKYIRFADWASKERPEEFKKQETGGYTAENCRLYLSLLREWRDKTSTEMGSAEQELIKLEKEWGDAEVRRDVAFFDRILSDDYMFTDPEGIVWTKAQYIANLKSGDLMVISSVLDETKVNIYGDSAVCFGRASGRAQLKGKDISSQYRFTDTWVKRAGRWQCVADHSSVIAQK